MLQAQQKMLDKLTVAVAIAGFCGLVGIVLLTVVDVVLRFSGGGRIPGFDDYGALLFPIVIASCFPVGLLHNRNITITFLGSGLGPTASRILNLFGSLLTLTVFVAIAWRFVGMTQELQAGGSVTPTVLLSVVPTWWISTILMWLTVPVQLWVCAVRVLELAQGRNILQAAESDAG